MSGVCHKNSCTCGTPQFSVCKNPLDCSLEELEEEEVSIPLDLNQHHFHKLLLHL